MEEELASAYAHQSAKELASLAPDEGRLLARIFDTATWPKRIADRIGRKVRRDDFDGSIYGTHFLKVFVCVSLYGDVRKTLDLCMLPLFGHY